MTNGKVPPLIAMNSVNAVAITSPVDTLFGLTISGPGQGVLSLNGPVTNIGSLTYAAPGTLRLSNPSKGYSGTTVIAGTMAVGANGAVIPTDSVVTVWTGANFDRGPFTNGSGNAPGNVALLEDGVLWASGATNSDLYTRQLTLTGGLIDFKNTPFTMIHVTGGQRDRHQRLRHDARWIGTNSGRSRIQNDTANPMNNHRRRGRHAIRHRPGRRHHPAQRRQRPGLRKVWRPHHAADQPE
jgi:hypothetical protein